MAIKLSKEEIRGILPSIQKYMLEEFEIEVGEMRAGFILDYFLTEIGPYAYNKGVKDAEQYFTEKAADISGTCYEHGMTYWNKKKK
jgi:uncharacterized protein (DUF2164 family)